MWLRAGVFGGRFALVDIIAQYRPNENPGAREIGNCISVPSERGNLVDVALVMREAAVYPWLRVPDLRPAFGIEACEMGTPMHFIQSVLGHSSVAVTEKYKFRPDAAAKAMVSTVESARKGRNLAQNLAQQG